MAVHCTLHIRQRATHDFGPCLKNLSLNDNHESLELAVPKETLRAFLTPNTLIHYWPKKAYLLFYYQTDPCKRHSLLSKKISPLILLFIFPNQ